jgi:hypothetical protein
MKNALRFSFVLGLLALAAPPLARADAPRIVGTWDGTASTPNGDMSLVLTVKQAEGALEAEITIEGAAHPASDEKLEGNVFRVRVHYGGAAYDVEVKVDGDVLEGQWQGQGYSGTLRAKRRQ